MKWYTKYLQYYNVSFDAVDYKIITCLQNQISKIETGIPYASVILIAHNEAKHLLSCIWSLVDNVCKYPIELIVVNNNSTDNTEQVLQKLGVTYYDEINKGPGFARQCGLRHAKGKYHLCIDSDTVYPPFYIATHIENLSRPNVVCTYSLWSFIPDKTHSKFSLWVYELLRDCYLRLQNINRPELCVRGMTFGFDTALARKIGFRTDIVRGEDGSLALAMKPYGKLVFITSRKARVLTGNDTLDANGSLLKKTKIRIQKLRGRIMLFKSQSVYDDREDNMIK